MTLLRITFLSKSGSKILSLMLRTLGKNFSRKHFEIFFFLIFPENRLRHFMQMISRDDNLQEMSMPIFCEKLEKYNQFDIC